jgi:hypothetical protein
VAEKTERVAREQLGNKGGTSYWRSTSDPTAAWAHQIREPDDGTDQTGIVNGYTVAQYWSDAANSAFAPAANAVEALCKPYRVEPGLDRALTVVA